MALSGDNNDSVKPVDLEMLVTLTSLGAVLGRSQYHSEAKPQCFPFFMVLVGMQLIFFVEALSILCFGFVMTIVLITP